MSNGNFDTNLRRMISAELYFLCGMTASREMYGKSYFALGVGERAVIDQTVLGAVGGNYRAITPEMLTQQQAQPAGFQSQTQPTQSAQP
jgi:hypothetical protein